MFPKLLLLSSLLFVSPLACTRIVKHYHYHFSAITFPTNQWNSYVRNILLEYYGQNRGSISTDEGELFAIVYDKSRGGEKIKDLIDANYVSYFSYLANTTCAKAVPILSKLVQIDDAKKLINDCQADYDAYYGEPTNGRRRLAVSGKHGSNH